MLTVTPLLLVTCLFLFTFVSLTNANPLDEQLIEQEGIIENRVKRDGSGQKRPETTVKSTKRSTKATTRKPKTTVPTGTVKPSGNNGNAAKDENNKNKKDKDTNNKPIVNPNGGKNKERKVNNGNQRTTTVSNKAKSPGSNNNNNNNNKGAKLKTSKVDPKLNSTKTAKVATKVEKSSEISSTRSGVIPGNNVGKTGGFDLAKLGSNQQTPQLPADIGGFLPQNGDDSASDGTGIFRNSNFPDVGGLPNIGENGGDSGGGFNQGQFGANGDFNQGGTFNWDESGVLRSSDGTAVRTGDGSVVRSGGNTERNANWDDMSNRHSDEDFFPGFFPFGFGGFGGRRRGGFGHGGRMGGGRFGRGGFRRGGFGGGRRGGFGGRIGH